MVFNGLTASAYMAAVKASSALSTRVLASQTTSGDSSGFVQSITQSLNNLLSTIQAIATPIATVVLAISGIMLLFGIGEKDQLKTAKNTFIAVFVAMLIIWFASPIVNMIAGFAQTN